MDALATVADMEDRSSDIPTASYTKANTALIDASATVRSYTGQQFTLATTTDLVKVRGGKIRLPQLPVTAVDAVTTVAGAAITFTWNTADRIDLGTNPLSWFETEPYRLGIPEALVTYTHGYDVIPDDVIAVVCQIALRTLTAEPSDAAVTQESLGSYSYSTGAVGAAGPTGLFNSEKAALNRYRRPGGIAVLAQ